jgi:hypothetical protein
MTEPTRQDDGLRSALQACWDEIRAAKDKAESDCHPGMTLALAMIARRISRLPPPSREAAEDKVDPCPVCGINNNSPFPCVDHATSPKPAPDAMQLLERIRDFPYHERSSAQQAVSQLAREAIAALSAPVPPAEGMPSIEQLRVAIADGYNNGNQQYEECDAFARMRFDAAAQAVARLSPSPAVAAEPVARRTFNPLDAGFTLRDCGCVGERCEGRTDGTCHATPPVRGDPGATDKTKFYAALSSRLASDTIDIVWQAVMEAEIFK